MGAIAASVLVTMIALIAFVYYSYEEKKEARKN